MCMPAMNDIINCSPIKTGKFDVTLCLLRMYLAMHIHKLYICIYSCMMMHVYTCIIDVYKEMTENGS